MARTAKQDQVRELQRTLYRVAKVDPGRRYPRALRQGQLQGRLGADVGLVCANRSAAGIDKQWIADVERYGVSRLLDELAADLRRGGCGGGLTEPLTVQVPLGGDRLPDRVVGETRCLRLPDQSRSN